MNELEVLQVTFFAIVVEVKNRINMVEHISLTLKYFFVGLQFESFKRIDDDVLQIVYN